MFKRIRIGVDLGGTKTEVIALGPEGEELYRHRRTSPRGDYQRSLENIVALVRDAEIAVGAEDATVGIGTPGSISRRTRLLRNANSTWLNNRPLGDDLASMLGPRVRLANDANCFALSEAVDGAGAGAESVFGVILGTGVGGGLVLNGRLIEGVNGVAGEWGHTPLPAMTETETPGPSCWCGRTGCIETWLSGPALAADHERCGGDAIPAKEIVAQAALGDERSQATLRRHEMRLGRALASVVNVFDPEVIVLGGGLSNTPHIADRALEAMRPHVFSDHVATRIVPNVHGDSSGVRGAAWLWPEDDA